MCVSVTVYTYIYIHNMYTYVYIRILVFIGSWSSRHERHAGQNFGRTSFNKSSFQMPKFNKKEHAVDQTARLQYSTSLFRSLILVYPNLCQSLSLSRSLPPSLCICNWICSIGYRRTVWLPCSYVSFFQSRAQTVRAGMVYPKKTTCTHRCW